MSLSYTLAVQKLFQTAGSLRRHDAVEHIHLHQCVGRTAAHDHASPISTPEFDSSAMDGYAICSADTLAASPEAPVQFLVRGVMKAGDVDWELPRVMQDQTIAPCVEIMTGAKFPTYGAPYYVFDACVRYEDMAKTELGLDGSKLITVLQPVPREANRRFAGSDIRRGEVVLCAGVKIQPSHIMCLASVGLEIVTVTPQLRVGILSTGDELVSTGSHVRDVNGPFLMAATQEAGVNSTFLGTIADGDCTLLQSINNAAESSDFDVLVSSGGVSVGKYDLVRRALEVLGADIIFHGLSIRPGHPVLFATLQTKHRPVAFFGLPGNPGATAACFRFFVDIYLRRLQGRPDERPLRTRLDLSAPSSKNCRQTCEGALKRGIDCFRPGIHQTGPAGEPIVRLCGQQGPSMLQPFITANCWVHLRATDNQNQKFADCYGMSSNKNTI